MTNTSASTLDLANSKAALVLNRNLPPGQLANTAAVLATTLGQRHPELVGADQLDASGGWHLGITQMALPVLSLDSKGLNELRHKLWQAELTVVDVTKATTFTRSYEAYGQYLADNPHNQVQYQGVALFGPKKLVNRFTGNLPLLR